MATQLNGVRVPLLIDGAMLIAGIITVTLLYSDVNRLKADQAEQVPVTRVVAIEEQLKAVNKTLDEMKEQQRKDTDRLISVLTDKKERNQ